MNPGEHGSSCFSVRTLKHVFIAIVLLSLLSILVLKVKSRLPINIHLNQETGAIMAMNRSTKINLIQSYLRKEKFGEVGTAAASNPLPTLLRSTAKPLPAPEKQTTIPAATTRRRKSRVEAIDFSKDANSHKSETRNRLSKSPSAVIKGRKVAEKRNRKSTNAAKIERYVSRDQKYGAVNEKMSEMFGALSSNTRPFNSTGKMANFIFDKLKKTRLGSISYRTPGNVVSITRPKLSALQEATISPVLEVVASDNTPHRPSDTAPHRNSDNMQRRNVPHKTLDNAPIRNPDNLSRIISNNVPHINSDNIPHRTSQNVPHRTSENIPHRTSHDTPHKISDTIQHINSDKMPRRISNNVLHKTLDDVPHNRNSDYVQRVAVDANVKLKRLQGAPSTKQGSTGLPQTHQKMFPSSKRMKLPEAVLPRTLDTRNSRKLDSRSFASRNNQIPNEVTVRLPTTVSPTSIEPALAKAYNLLYEGSQPAKPQADKESCPAIPSNLIGEIKVYEQSFPINQLNSLNFRVEAGGTYTPPDCNPSQKVAIVIPFRNRDRHLAMLLLNLHPLLQKQQRAYTIFIVNQVEGSKFNRAMLMNVGFMEAMKKDKYTCVIFHDVDLLPQNDKNIYMCPEDNPRHMSAYIDKFGYKLPYVDILGGIVAVNSRLLVEVNGYSNQFFGWGGEDDDFSARFRRKGHKIVRYPQNVGRYKMIRHGKDSGNEPNPRRFEMLKYTGRRQAIDGLNTITYDIQSIQRLPLYTKLNVLVNQRAVMNASPHPLPAFLSHLS